MGGKLCNLYREVSLFRGELTARAVRGERKVSLSERCHSFQECLREGFYCSCSRCVVEMLTFQLCQPETLRDVAGNLEAVSGDEFVT